MQSLTVRTLGRCYTFFSSATTTISGADQIRPVVHDADALLIATTTTGRPGRRSEQTACFLIGASSSISRSINAMAWWFEYHTNGFRGEFRTCSLCPWSSPGFPGTPSTTTSRCADMEGETAELLGGKQRSRARSDRKVFWRTDECHHSLAGNRRQ